MLQRWRESFSLGRVAFLQQAKLASRWQRHARNLFARNLRVRIEVAQRLQFISEKFQPHRPRTGGRKNVHDAAAQGDFTLRRDLDLGVVAVVLQPLDEIERVHAPAAPQRARAGRQCFDEAITDIMIKPGAMYCK